MLARRRAFLCRSAQPPRLVAIVRRYSSRSPHQVTLDLAKQHKLPLFSARAEQIQLLDSPSRFYQTLKDKVSSAKDRIFLASLYIGKEETKLVKLIRDSLSSRPALRLTILTDALRSTREQHPSPSGASLVASLARDFPNQVDLRLYHTPTLKGLTKNIVGKRFNEGWGLQHMKIYGFDDDVVISGANLSRDYFTNRRDRYMIVSRHGQMSDYLHSLVLLVSRFSYALTCTSDGVEHANYRLEWDGGDKLLLNEDVDGSVTENGKSSDIELYPERNWDGMAQKAVERFTERWHAHTLDTISQDEEVMLLPLIQMGPLHIRQETRAIPSLFSLAETASQSSAQPSTLDLTSGYFSLYPPYKALLSKPRTEASSAQVRIICAAPESNGFFNSKGVSGWIPEAYTWFEKTFWTGLKKNDRLSGPNGGVEIKEWKKEGWTYHAKGIWYTTPGDEEGPSVFHIGSSNYGSRSSDRDLECTLLVSTRSGELKGRLKQEVNGLREDAVDEVDQNIFERPDRKVRKRVRIAAWLIGGML